MYIQYYDSPLGKMLLAADEIGLIGVWFENQKYYADGGSLTLAHSQNSQMSFMYGFFFVKFLFFTVVCVVIVV